MSRQNFVSVLLGTIDEFDAISRAWVINYTPQDTKGYNHLSMLKIYTSGSKVSNNVSGSKILCYVKNSTVIHFLRDHLSGWSSNEGWPLTMVETNIIHCICHLLESFGSPWWAPSGLKWEPVAPQPPVIFPYWCTWKPCWVAVGDGLKPYAETPYFTMLLPFCNIIVWHRP